jgi:hypothetical protein
MCITMRFPDIPTLKGINGHGAFFREFDGAFYRERSLLTCGVPS